MSKVVSLKTAPDRAKEDAAKEALKALEGVTGLPAGPLATISGILRRKADPDRRASRLKFTMFFDDAMIAIWDAIDALPPSARPHKVLRAMNMALSHQDWSTGRVLLTRDELANLTRCSSDNLSHIMSTLEKLGVIRREMEAVEGLRGRGRAVYYVNPHLAWKGDMSARAELMETVPPPAPLREARQREFQLITGGLE